MSRLARASVAALAILLLAGCATVKAPPPTPSATASADPTQLIGGTIDPVGTTWSGTDSAGDLSSFTLRPDHGVRVTYGTVSFDQQGDTWSVHDGVLQLHVYIDATNGYLDYTAAWSAASKTLAATATSTVSRRSVTVTLTEK